MQLCFQVAAQSLNANCYEDKADEDDVANCLALCVDLSERLYELFWLGGGAESRP